MERISLLVVEDDAKDAQSWTREIERHNAATESTNLPEIELLLAKTRDEAKQTLLDRRVDAVVVDLRLDGNQADPENAGGNEVLRTVLDSEPAVIAVFTGEPARVDVPNYARAQVQVIRKGGGDDEGTPAVMEWLRRQFKLIACMKSARGSIEQHIANVFAHSVWPRWRFWIENSADDDNGMLGAAIARHITSHVHEQLSRKMEGRAHAEEWYLLPANPNLISTGDLIRSTQGEIEVVVTPRCDLATKKFETIQLAWCQDISSEWDQANIKIKALSEALAPHAADSLGERDAVDRKLKAAKEERRKLTNHAGNRTSSHFLPRMKLSDGSSIGPLVVRFDRVRWMSKETIDDATQGLGTRMATLSPIFLPSLVERLGSYFSRIGTPDYHHFDEPSAPT